MKHAALLLLAALAAPALTGCDGAPTAARGQQHTSGGIDIRKTGTANATAQGAYSIVFGTNTEDISFLVSNNGSSATSGWAMFYSHNAGVVAYINVTCLYVSNHVATFLGTVVASSDGTIVNDDAYWQVVDGSPDQSSTVSLAAHGDGPSCTTPGEFDLVNLSKGSLTVTP
jgi:hypothetical protein